MSRPEGPEKTHRRRDFLYRGLIVLSAAGLGSVPWASDAGDLVCPECGAPTKEGAHFCTQCGLRLSATSSSPKLLADTLEDSVFSVQMPPTRLSYLGTRTLHGNAFAIRTDILIADILFSEDVKAMEVRSSSGERLQLRLLYADPCLGLMFLKVLGKKLKPLHIAPPGDLRFGQQIQVACIPNLRGSKTQLTLVEGIVSGMHRLGLGLSQLEDYIQIDAVVPGGSAGAPVLDLGGRLIGIYSSAAYLPMAYRMHRMSGINYANSAVLVQQSLVAAQSGSAPSWSWLGLQIDINPGREEHKLVVRFVFPQAVGFQSGDELVRIGEQEVNTIPYSVLQRTIAEQPVGTPITVEIRRHDKTVTLKPVLMRRPSWPRLAPLDVIQWVLGVRIGSLDGKHWTVDKVSEWRGSHGILASDTVHHLNGEKIKGIEHLAALVEASYGEHALTLALTLRSRRTGKSHPTYTGRAFYRFSHPSTL